MPKPKKIREYLKHRDQVEKEFWEDIKKESKSKKIENLGEKIRNWYKTYNYCPSWSSMLGFMVREIKQEKQNYQKELAEKINAIACKIPTGQTPDGLNHWVEMADLDKAIEEILKLLQ